jgi:hypothetical protein
VTVVKCEVEMREYGIAFTIFFSVSAYMGLDCDDACFTILYDQHRT